MSYEGLEMSFVGLKPLQYLPLKGADTAISLHINYQRMDPLTLKENGNF
jgi:hypothetical protein